MLPIVEYGNLGHDDFLLCSFTLLAGDPRGASLRSEPPAIRRTAAARRESRGFAESPRRGGPPARRGLFAMGPDWQGSTVPAPDGNEKLIFAGRNDRNRVSRTSLPASSKPSSGSSRVASFLAAARALRLTWPSVSQRIREWIWRRSW